MIRYSPVHSADGLSGAGLPNEGEPNAGAADPAAGARPADDPKAAKILAAAKTAFLELGYADASMDVVARRASASKTTVYSRFPSKEALFAATIAGECGRWGLGFAPEDFDAATIEEALLAIGRRYLGLVWSPDALRIRQIVMGEASKFPELARAYLDAGPRRVWTLLAALFARAAARGAARVDDPAFAAEQFLAALRSRSDYELVLGLREPPPPAEVEAFLADAIRLFVRGLRPDAGPAPG
jgi:TetR/AcrR family transcriptional repressor of mexJK operon